MLRFEYGFFARTAQSSLMILALSVESRMEKFFVTDLVGFFAQNLHTQKEWKVQIVSPRVCDLGSILATRSCISVAALLVKVIAATICGR